MYVSVTLTSHECLTCVVDTMAKDFTLVYLNGNVIFKGIVHSNFGEFKVTQFFTNDDIQCLLVFFSYFPSWNFSTAAFYLLNISIEHNKLLMKNLRCRFFLFHQFFCVCLKIIIILKLLFGGANGAEDDWHDMTFLSTFQLRFTYSLNKQFYYSNCNCYVTLSVL